MSTMRPQLSWALTSTPSSFSRGPRADVVEHSSMSTPVRRRTSSLRETRSQGGANSMAWSPTSTRVVPRAAVAAVETISSTMDITSL